MLEALLTVYFCVAGDVCNRFTTSSWSFYVSSCDKGYVEGEIRNMVENETSSIEYEVVDYACFEVKRD
jgi:hypothetical protein|tara:strand:+ start:827 stop:1030 length:204 start_codon:yes stop_codon:yes gene_type:complete